ncbi:hypothetical protein DFH08DRAFT_797975 [Mycena albidolilacea]|uniref:Uncharacterized protein n=1 Tax=Mycena albidolilacea TaxID=1033008 RepID=A0AAD7F381_9AGAR|nr:hypothetical protein DFH08DRAFT_797975 [Mycena albidolilacea]
MPLMPELAVACWEWQGKGAHYNVHQARRCKVHILMQWWPVIVHEFELAFMNYCTIKDITDDKQTKTLIRCFCDHHVTDVLADPEERKTLLKGTVPNFMKQIRSIVLQPGWEDDHRITMMACRHLQSDSFFMFASTIRSMNSLVVNTESHLTNERLCSHLKSVMCRDLLDDYRANPIAKAVATTKLSLWLHKVKHIDDARLHSYNWMKAAIEEVECKLNKRLALPATAAA